MEKKRDKSLIGGILSIVSGAFGILYGAGIAVFTAFFFSIFVSLSPSPGMNQLPPQFFTMLVAFYSVIGGVLVLLGILGIVSGAFALKQKYWGLALAGAIAGIFTFLPCGIAAVIFISLGRPEFTALASLE